MTFDDKQKEKIVNEIKKLGPEERIKAIGLFKVLHDTHVNDEEYEKKKLTVEFETHAKQKALFNSALDIYKGNTNFSKEAVKNFEDFFTPEEFADPELEKYETTEPVKSVWLILLKKIPAIKAFITEEDEKVLEYLDHVEVFKSQDNEDFRVEFSFKKNDYFSNDILKIEVLIDDGDESGETIKEIKSSEIKWNIGKDIRKVEVKPKGKPKKGKNPKALKYEKINSFFWLFDNHQRPDDQDDNNGEDEEADLDNPLSDDNLYYQAVDTLHILHTDVYEYAIPAMFEMQVDVFKNLTDFKSCDEDDHEEQKVEKDKIQNPECKQQ